MDPSQRAHAENVRREEETRSGKIEQLTNQIAIGEGLDGNAVREGRLTTHWLRKVLSVRGAEYCVLAFQEEVEGADTFRSRYDPPHERLSWLLVSFSTGVSSPRTEGMFAAVLDLLNGSDAIAWRGEANASHYAREFGLAAANPELDSQLTSELESSHGKVLDGTAEEVWDRIAKIVAQMPSELLPRAERVPSSSLPIWTTKVPSNRALRLFVSPKTSEPCVSRLTRTMLAYGQRGAPKEYPEHDVKAVELVSDLDFNVTDRTVRIEFFDSYDSVRYCTGYLLSPNLVLTAGHCVFEQTEGNDPVLDCLNKMTRCASYTVDVSYWGRAGPFISVPVVRASGGTPVPSGKRYWPQPDYAFLQLATDVPALPMSVPTMEVRMLEDGRLESEGRLDVSLRVVEHPHGSRAKVDNDCDVLRGNDGLLLHSCYTQGGSSGSIVWLKSDSIPVALHNKYAQQCGTDKNSSPQVESVFDLVPRGISLEHEELKSMAVGNPCIGVAVTIPMIQRNHCKGRLAIPECQALKNMLSAWRGEVFAH